MSNDKCVEYGTALISMPYRGSFRITKLPKTQALAERERWQYAELAEETLRTWSISFKR